MKFYCDIEIEQFQLYEDSRIFFLLEFLTQYVNRKSSKYQIESFFHHEKARAFFFLLYCNPIDWFINNENIGINPF